MSLTTTLSAIAITSFLVSAPTTATNTNTEVLQPVVISVKTVKPPSKLKKTKQFVPWAKPSVKRVQQIIKIEAKRWKVDPARLRGRIYCESSFIWNEVTGSYYGLGQFHPSTWARAISSLGTRKVRFTKEHQRTVKIYQYTTWSDGIVKKKLVGKKQQTVITVFKGLLPKKPGILHGYAQVRAVARAMAGLGNVSDSEWECR